MIYGVFKFSSISLLPEGAFPEWEKVPKADEGAFANPTRRKNTMKRTVFFVSDGTGITAENLGQSLLTQFEDLHFEKITLSYIDT